MWGCKPHWMQLPYGLRKQLWDAYEPGQEETLDVSDEYLRVAHMIQRWIRAKLAAKERKNHG